MIGQWSDAETEFYAKDKLMIGEFRKRQGIFVWIRRGCNPCSGTVFDSIIKHIVTVIAAPMTTKGRSYPTRVTCRFQGKDGQIVLDQVRTIDKKRLLRKPGRISKKTQADVLDTLAEMFAR